MLLFIGSEAMLFGSFFAALVLRRVVNPSAPGTGRPRRSHFPVFVAGVNTCILVTSSFTMHWALQSIRRERPRGLKAGLTLTILLGLAFLLTQAIEYAHVGFNTGDGAFASAFFGLTGLHGAHVFIGLSSADRRRASASAGTTRPSTITGRDPGDLLALRRRNVDRRVHDRLSPLIGGVRNPFRDEGAAFRFVLAAIGAFGLIALGSWISTWLGFLFSSALCSAVAVYFGQRGEGPDPHTSSTSASPDSAGSSSSRTRRSR